MSDKGQASLRVLLNELDGVVKLHLDAGKPANIEPLRVNLKPDATPIRAKQRRYPLPKKEFVKKTTAPDSP